MTEQNILKDGIVTFFSRKKEYKSLSNFWENDVSIEDGYSKRDYESGEHCFHGEKYTRLGELCEDLDRRKKLLNYGTTFQKPSSYKSGAIAKRMGGKNGLLLNSEELKLWITISAEVQYKICKWKFDNYREVKEDLLKSENKILIHPAMRCNQENIVNKLWEGKAVIIDKKIKVLGGNLLGKIWMELREISQV